MNRLDAGILETGVLLAGRGLVVVVDAPDEGRDKADATLGAGDGLWHGEHKRQVAVDLLLLKDLGGADALPGRGDLDKDSLAVGAGLLVEADEVAGLFKGSLGVKGETGVDLGADPAWDNLENLAAKKNQGVVDDLLEKRRTREARSLVVGDRLV